MYHEKTVVAAKGKWRGILMGLGMPRNFLVNKHGPCPLCGGKDRFRWDNKEGSGSYICGQCGAGNGIQLAQKFTNMEFRDVASQIDDILGNIKPDEPSHISVEVDEVRVRDMLRSAYASSKLVVVGDLADRYLKSRGLHTAWYPDSLRFAPELVNGDGGVSPCLLAVVTGVAGTPITMHRTFLRHDGSAKADIKAPRKLFPGKIPDGACVRLSDPCRHMGIAEGIETAMSASSIFDLPVWAAINSTMLKKWTPPEECEELTIFADNDEKFGGQSAAYELAHKLAVKGLRVDVQIPMNVGDDWNDVLKSTQNTPRMDFPGA